MKLKACLLVVSLTLKRSTLALKNRILRITGKYPNKGCDDLWEWFGLSRASWLTMPRILMHEMPAELCDYRHPCRKDIERLKVK